MATTVRVPGGAIAFGGWKGVLEIDGDVLRVVGRDSANHLEVDCSQVKRYSFNRINGLWALRMKDGKKLCLQTTGLVLSADRSPAARVANRSIKQLLANHDARRFSI